MIPRCTRGGGARYIPGTQRPGTRSRRHGHPAHLHRHRERPPHPQPVHAAAARRAEELGVADRVEFIHGDAAGYVTAEKVDVAACLGATWIGGGVAGTVGLLARSLRPGGIILVGEPYWLRLPPTEEVARGCLAHSISDFLLLPEIVASFGDLGYDVVEMVLADPEGWDRYEAAKWLTMRRWLEANPGDEFAKEVRAQLTSEPKRYVTCSREYLGWGVFALMAR
jgi:SAM-dependent methyltransferase